MALSEEDLAWVEEQLAKAPPNTQHQIDVMARLLATVPDPQERAS